MIQNNDFFMIDAHLESKNNQTHIWFMIMINYLMVTISSLKTNVGNLYSKKKALFL